MQWTLHPVTVFSQYQTQWDTLNLEGINTPLLDSRFVVPLLHYFAGENDRLAICGSTDKPDAMAIITQRKFGVWETLQPSQAPLGLWLQRLTIPTAQLLESLRPCLPFPTMLVGITQQDPDLLPRPAHEGKLSTLDYIETARISVIGSFEDYWATRGKNLRQNLKRQRNRLERENISNTLKILVEEAAMPQAVVDYGRLESAGWKYNNGTAVNINNIQGCFYRDMLINFCNSQNSLVFQYYYHDQLVASDLCIHNNNTLVILKTTYRENVLATSPALLMRQEAFEYVFNSQLVEKIEFYGKVMDWHTKWTEEMRMLYHINYQILARR
jgi:Acetyltransferase (GNAT) domain